MDLAFFLYKDLRQVRAAARILRQLYAAFMEHGASLVEINPLVTTKGTGDLVAVDAKMSIDDNELERHPGLAALRDESAEAPSEIAARQGESHLHQAGRERRLRRQWRWLGDGDDGSGQVLRWGAREFSRHRWLVQP